MVFHANLKQITTKYIVANSETVFISFNGDLQMDA